MTYTVEARGVEGNKRIVCGTFAMGSGDTSGDIVTGLRNVEFAMAATSSGVRAVRVQTNYAGSAVAYGSIKLTVATAGDDGFWFAIGY